MKQWRRFLVAQIIMINIIIAQNNSYIPADRRVDWDNVGHIDGNGMRTAIPRSIYKTFNVLTYNATAGDGTTDATSAVNAAIAAATNTSNISPSGTDLNVIYFPAGTYWLPNGFSINA